jgi:hypothetical protein
LIREALQWLGDLKAEALKPMKLVDRPDRKLFLARDGKTLDVLVPAEPRAHQVNTIGDFATAAKRWRTARSVVFHNESAVWFCVDDADRRDVVMLPLRHTDVFSKVVDLEQHAFDQRTFLRLLRHDLAGVIPPTLVAAIQRIEVVTSGNQRSEITPGRERGTREFAADLAASGEIPERVTCEVPVYRLPGVDYRVPIMFSLDYTLPPGPVTFRFCPLPDEIEKVIDSLQGELHRLLVEALEVDELLQIDVLYGALSCSKH